MSPILRSVVGVLVAGIFAVCGSAAQSVHLYDVRSENFPRMAASFYAFDGVGRQQRPGAGDIRISEGGAARSVLSVSCPQPSEPRRLSSVLVVDVSGSMSGERMVLAKEGLVEWITNFPFGTGECALTSFNTTNYLHQDFTTDQGRLLEAVSTLSPEGGTSYDAALIAPMSGGLMVSKAGKHRRTIVLLTDGQAGFADLEVVKAEADRQECVVYVITLAMLCPESLKDLATHSGGLFFEDVTTVEEIAAAYRLILNIAQTGGPCTVEWQSAYTCERGARRVELGWSQQRSSAGYTPPGGAVARLAFDPLNVRFQTPPMGVPATRQVTVTAENTAFTVQSVDASHPGFSISPTSFSLAQGESRTLTVSYLPQDSGNAFCQFTFRTDVCDVPYFAGGGYRTKKPTAPTLTLQHPKGGETFVVGADTSIVWSGVADTDTVELDYSYDRGRTWNHLARTAGLEYRWLGVPRPAGDSALVRVSQKDYPANYDPLNPRPQVLWQRAYGGTEIDEAKAVAATSDGAYVVVGATASNNGDVAPAGKGKRDYWVVKVDAENSTVLWQKRFGGSRDDIATAVAETSDGAYLVVGHTESADGDVADSRKGADWWLLKLRASDGSIVWQKTYGGSEGDYATAVLEAADGTYMVSGYTGSPDGDVTTKREGTRDYDYRLLKVSPQDGSIVWQKTYGGTARDQAHGMIESQDGNYVLVGFTESSNNGDVSGKKGNADCWVVKASAADGTIIWQKPLGGSSLDYGYSVMESADGAYVVASTVYSNNGDVTNHRGGTDYWVTKLDRTDGTIVWEKALGGGAFDNAQSIVQGSDNGYVILGASASEDGDITGSRGLWDYWVVKVRGDNGNIVWERSLGGSSGDNGFSIAKDPYDSFVLVGTAVSNDGDVSGNRGNGDYWVVKLSEGVTLQSDTSKTVFSVVEPRATASDIDMGECVLGWSRDSVVAPFTVNTGSWPFDVDTIYFRGPDAAAFSLVSGIPGYTLSTGASRAAEFRFAPLRLGGHRADVVVVTQSDTLVRSIVGIGVAKGLVVSSPYIDFGRVDIYRDKDTLQVVAVRNTGDAPVAVRGTRHDVPNASDFTTLAGGGAFTLQPGESRRVDVRFTPSSVGRTNGTLKFDYDGPGSPAVVQLFGEGVMTGPRVGASAVVFDAAVCSDSATAVALLENTGGRTLVVTALTISGVDAAHFSVSQALPITLEPRDSARVELVFTSSAPGSKAAVLEVWSNASADTAFTLALAAAKERVELYAQDTVDIGYLCPGADKSFRVALRNTGTAFTEVRLSDVPQVDFVRPSVDIAPGENYDAEALFTGLDTPGPFALTVEVEDMVCGTKASTVVRGYVIVPRPQVDAVQMNASVGNTAQGRVVIRNTWPIDIEITEIEGLQPPMGYSASLPLVIPANDSAVVDVFFTPSDTGSVEQTLLVYSSPCNTQARAVLRGSTAVASVLVYTDVLSAYPGEEVNIPVVLREQSNVAEAGITSFSFDVVFNPTLLSPIGYSFAVLDAKTARLKVQDVVPRGVNGDTLAVVRCVVGLGNAERCDLLIDSVRTAGGEATVRVQQGSFALLGVCYDGGIRLLSPYEGANSLSVSPNPGSERVKAVITVVEKDAICLEMRNVAGALVFAKDFVNITGTSVVELPVENIPHGVYFVVLKTPTTRYVQKLVVHK